MSAAELLTSAQDAACMLCHLKDIDLLCMMLLQQLYAHASMQNVD